MIILGMTGSIGTGKSTTAKMFAARGIPVNDADQVVHDLYEGEAAPLVEAAFPGSTHNGVVDRARLGRILVDNPEGFKRLEAIVHPLVRQKEKAFLTRHRDLGTAAVLLDIPLLFETGASDRVDHIVVVSCDPETQRQRVLQRPGMSEEKFAAILARQVPDAEKRKRADFIIETDEGLEAAEAQVDAVLAALDLI
ncbi:dephospho-CoA kinase [Pseudohoeflea coraliihabitans]|uniref:Dephospho-CoA kinase n=1 Tax=Pseudohoeflea coraliihabitans TaxID=2860393 RepID=A0ABS6WVL1_9HYPH|nr:dephospho-CoA kinase [Pseudohoeflea sp. DP4N28-3]MBW3099134.1 dephospho-CoA kinase [Pseudohoeflea sp. DP4N28-3]